MKIKVCFKCGQEKPITEFYKHPKMGDGHLNKCKECTKQDVKQNYQKRRAYYAGYERERSRKLERRQKAIEYQRRRRKKNVEKYRAHIITNNAIRDGKLKRGVCEICGSPFVEAHHEDYNKPLKVTWLCRKHHLERHGKKAYEVSLTERR